MSASLKIFRRLKKNFLNFYRFWLMFLFDMYMLPSPCGDSVVAAGASLILRL